ncbi:MAG: T9SS type A sorting domain-containing protein [Bacteroidetes bacterium]|nr:T9SS type A sorting domain-containing protein [Bacteroidota bacterium]
MKKTYLVICLSILGTGAFAQRMSNLHSFKGIPSTPALDSGIDISNNSFALESTRGHLDTLFYEDFVNGLMGNNVSTTPAWSTFSNFCSWNYSLLGSQGQFAGTGPIVNSTTKANGFMLLDGDACNPGAAAGFQDVDATLQSPVIDLTNKPNAVLTFQHGFRWCCTAASVKFEVEISGDGGNSWTSYDVMDKVQSNITAGTGTAAPLTKSINISAIAGGQSNVIIKFRKSGVSHYYWMIDDVTITEAPENDLILDYVFFGEYSSYPLAQVANMEFTGSVNNFGYMPQTDVTLKAEVLKNAGSVFSTANAPYTLASQKTDTLTLPTAFTPTEKGEYEIEFSVSQNETDHNLMNNSKKRNFNVTDSVFSRDNNMYTNRGYARANKATYTLGNIFEVQQDGYVTSISFVLQHTSETGAEVRVKLYDASFEILATSEVYDVVASDINGQVTQVLNSPKTVTLSFYEPYYVEKGFYLAAVEHLNPTKGVNIATGTDITQPLQQSYVEVNSDWFYTTLTPMIRMNMDATVGINKEEANGTKLFQNQPNPSKNMTTIRYELGNSAKVTLDVFDISGRHVLSVNEGDKPAGLHSINISTANLNGGIYYYTLNTGNARATKKMVVVQ